MFFLILRRGISSTIENISYFSGYENRYEPLEHTETDGIEIWHEDETNSLRFETFTEAKCWLDSITKDVSHYAYEIILARRSTDEDISKRGEYCSTVISLKTFYTTQEY